MITDFLLRDVVTYWEPATSEEYGIPSFKDPIYPPAKWVDKEELVTVRNQIIKHSKAIIYSEREMKNYGYLYLGETDEKNPLLLKNAYRIIRSERQTNMRYNRKMYKYYV